MTMCDTRAVPPSKMDCGNSFATIDSPTPDRSNAAPQNRWAVPRVTTVRAKAKFGVEAFNECLGDKRVAWARDQGAGGARRP